MESIIRQSITDHFKDNNAFSNKQFGFIKDRSTFMQLLEVMDMWTESLESGGQIDVIHTDLEKVFDKVHIKDWLANCIKIKSIQGIESFLANRRKRVRINGFFSF